MRAVNWAEWTVNATADEGRAEAVVCSATAGLLFYRKRFATRLWGIISAVTSIASSPDHAQHLETSEKVLLVSDAVNQ